jgi:hypothetical protein
VEDLSLILRPGFSIGGRVVVELGPDSSNPPDKVAIVVEAADAIIAPSLRSVEVTPDGRFSTAELPPGRYLIKPASTSVGSMWASALYGNQDLTDLALDLSADVNGVVVSIRRQLAEISGAVQTPRGTVDQEATVVIFPADRRLRVDYGLASRLVRMIPCDIDGRYRIPALPAGTYYVRALLEENLEAWPAPDLLAALEAGATAVQLTAAERRTVNLVRSPGSSWPRPSRSTGGEMQ